MPEVHRLTDTNTAGAAIIGTKQTTVTVGGLPVATDGDPVEGHGTGVHASPVTANGSATVTIGGIPVNRKGDEDSCGHPRAAGFPTVFVGE